MKETNCPHLKEEEDSTLFGRTFVEMKDGVPGVANHEGIYVGNPGETVNRCEAAENTQIGDTDVVRKFCKSAVYGTCPLLKAKEGK